MRKKTKTLQSYLQNTGMYQASNFTHGYPGVWKASMNHTTPIQEDVACVSRKNNCNSTVKIAIVKCRHWNKYKLKTLVTNIKDRGIT